MRRLTKIVEVEEVRGDGSLHTSENSSLCRWKVDDNSLGQEMGNIFGEWDRSRRRLLHAMRDGAWFLPLTIGETDPEWHSHRLVTGDATNPTGSSYHASI